MRKVAIIGDFSSSKALHCATNAAIAHSRDFLRAKLCHEWIPTNQIEQNFSLITSSYAGFWIAPGAFYEHMEQVLRIIAFAREASIPTLGTCGGFQLMVIEFARNVLQIKEADHEERVPGKTSKLVITSLPCSLKGKTGEIFLTKAPSKVASLLQTSSLTEHFYCNFGVAPEYRRALQDHGFIIVGTGADQEVRIMELQNHRFFIGTLFAPQASSSEQNPHKLITGFLEAVITY